MKIHIGLVQYTARPTRAMLLLGLSLVVGVALVFAIRAASVESAINAVVTDTGKISLSVDGLGTNAASGLIQVDKPSGGTVRSAHFACASNSSSGAIPNGGVSIDGTPIIWSLTVVNLTWHNHYADVTTVVAAGLNAASPGIVNVTISEATPSAVDGCILAVVFNDPAQLVDLTAVLLFGAQTPSGDTFTISLSNPIVLSDPNLVLDMGLGISFGFQEFGGPGPFNRCGTNAPQASRIDVNGSRLTSCAGNYDDGAASNGALLTVGGVGDSNGNPSDPNQAPADGGTPRVIEDELYDLIPFVGNGDTSISVATLNPSNDDNIFFAHVLTLGAASVTTEICNDGIDNDLDGFTDATDPDCFTPTNTPTGVSTITPTPTATNTPILISTDTPTISPSDTPEATNTTTTATNTPSDAIIVKVPEQCANGGDAGDSNADCSGDIPLANLFLCEAPAACAGQGEGNLIVFEYALAVQDSPETGIQGLGGYEFSVEYDNFVIKSVNPCDIVFGTPSADPNNLGGADAILDGAGVGRGPVDELETSANPYCDNDVDGSADGTCAYSIVLESVVHFGCVTSGPTPVGPLGNFDLAALNLIPHEDLRNDIFPGNNNGVVTILKDNGCELVDILGHPVPGSINGGLTVECGDLSVTVRILEGDLDLDCDVDVTDAQMISFRYGAFFGGLLYSKWFDLEPELHDLDIDIKDVQKVFGREGSTCQAPIPDQPPLSFG